jgi:hypothetical protein
LTFLATIPSPPRHHTQLANAPLAANTVVVAVDAVVAVLLTRESPT